MQFWILILLAITLPLAYFALTKKTEPSQTVVILLGAPASGKGTQAVQLAESLKVPHISTGDLFRYNISQNTELGKKAKSFIDQGKLVPDDLVVEMVFDRIKAADAANGYILDGFPRTIFQADALGSKLPANTRLFVLNLDVSDDTIVKRALSRKRSDDTPEVVKERLRTYHEHTAPLLDYYQKKGLLKNIDGEKSPEEVGSALKQALK
jgi:adenylate kinase